MDSLTQLQQNVHNLLEHCKMLQKDNDTLREEIAIQRQEILRSHTEVAQLQKQCRTLATANAIAGEPATREEAYRKLTSIIAQIDKALNTLTTE